MGLSVPPTSAIVERAPAQSSAGSTVWSTSVVLPAVPISKL